MREWGRDIQVLLRLYKETTTKPLSSCVLSTPTHKVNPKSAAIKQKAVAHDPEGKMQKERKSPRLQAKLAKGKSVVKLVEELVARKCGILDEDQDMDNMTLRQYIAMYKKPLTKESTEAIMKLTEVAKKKKSKKLKKTKKTKSKGALIQKGKKGKKPIEGTLGPPFKLI